MSWLFLFFAGLLEIVWATGLKYTDGFSRFWPTIITIVTAAGSFWFLSIAMKTIPLGTAYAVWTGIGAVGAVVVGIIIFGESITFFRLFSVALIIAGIIGLKLSSVD